MRSDGLIIFFCKELNSKNFRLLDHIWPLSHILCCCILFFWQCWGLNLGVCACSAGAVPLKAISQPFSSGYFGDGTGLDHDPPIYASHSSWNDRYVPLCPVIG
jgi:hypothetical protein